MKFFATLVAVTLAACGGAAKTADGPPPPAKPSAPPHLAIVIDRENSYDATGEAFVQLDPEQSLLAVFVFDAQASPKPSCDTLAMASLNLQSGGFAAIRMRGYDTKTTGTFPITGAGFISGNVRTHETRMASSGPEASSLVVSTFDSSHFVAEITSEPSAEMQVHGAISATVCPDGPLGSAGQPPPDLPVTSAVTSIDTGTDTDAGAPVKPSKSKKRKKHHH